MADWWLLAKTTEAGEPGPAFLNLDLVQTVEIISSDSLRIRFSLSQTMTVEGKSASDLVAHLMTKSHPVNRSPK